MLALSWQKISFKFFSYVWIFMKENKLPSGLLSDQQLIHPTHIPCKFKWILLNLKYVIWVCFHPSSPIENSGLTTYWQFNLNLLVKWCVGVRYQECLMMIKVSIYAICNHRLLTNKMVILHIVHSYLV